MCYQLVTETDAYKGHTSAVCLTYPLCQARYPLIVIIGTSVTARYKVEIVAAYNTAVTHRR